MSDTHEHTEGHDGDHIHPPPSNFITKYIFSTDHKVIALQFLLVSTMFFVVGGTYAFLIRLQLAHPFKPLEILGMRFDWLAHLAYGNDDSGKPLLTMPPEIYPSLVTLHGTIMIFLVIIPLLTGFFGNYLIPLQIGARDMAFPFLNMVSFWSAIPAGFCMLHALMAKTPPGAGWTSYPPLSAVHEAGAGDGQTWWLLSIIFVGASSIMGGLNYLTTIINLRAPGMKLTRMPLSVWALFITSILQVMATPVLASALVMLLLDHTVGTTFFLPTGLSQADGTLIGNAGGGHPLLFQHVFWFYSHPAVYILVLPAMGLVSDILPVFCRKPIFGYKAMAYSMAGIAGLGFIVWAHHMFQAGINPTLATGFMISTMVIGVPSSVKVFNWLGTLWGSAIRFTTPMLNCLAFISMFIIGGLSGVFLASTPVDIFLHDTYYVVAHFHYVVFGGSVFASFAGIYFWWPKVTGKKLDETLGKIHFALSFIGFNGVFFPMHILGMAGMMRRIADPNEYLHLQHLQSWNVHITEFAFLLGAAQLLLVANIVWTTLAGEPAGDNPWECTTLPWTISSPPPYYNYKTIPTVYHGPYEYSVPGMERDYLMQTEKVDVALAGGHA